jgi:flagellar assembly protein FliH
VTTSSEADATAREPWEPPALARSGATARGAAEVAAPAPEQLREAARREGFEAGFSEGVAAGRAQAESMAGEMQAILNGLAAPLADLDGVLLQELLALVQRVAAAVLKRELEAGDSAMLEAVLREALAALGDVRTTVELRLHPQDAALCRDNGLSQGETYRLIEDPRLERGDVQLSVDGGFVDARVESRLAAVMDALSARALAKEPVADGGAVGD